jgi:hypothetical protein
MYGVGVVVVVSVVVVVIDVVVIVNDVVVVVIVVVAEVIFACIYIYIYDIWVIYQYMRDIVDAHMLSEGIIYIYIYI